MATSHSRLQFSLLNLFAMMCLVGLFLGMRTYVFSERSLKVFERALQMPVLFASLAIALDWLRWPSLRIWRTIALGAGASLIVATLLAIELAEMSRPAYWDWSKNFPEFAIIVGAFALLGGVLGLAAAAIRKLVTSIAARLPTRFS